MTSPTIVPVILSGGSGTRLWPVSRSEEPKQLLAMVDDRTMLRATMDRLRGVAGVEDPVVVCSHLHQHLVARELGDAGFAPSRIILEPVGRNTAPAVAAAALAATGDGADPILLILPADHVIEDEEAFRTAVAIGAGQAADGKLVTFGIVPEYAETGYGYVQRGAPVAPDAYDVAAFVEKPDAPTAADYVASGEYFWNSGMFMFHATRYLTELERFAPDILAATRAAVDGGLERGGLHLDGAAFADCRSESIDYAVMEQTDAAVVVPLSAGWNDVGSWAALWSVSPQDSAGNVTHGDVIAIDTTNAYLRAESRLLAVIDGDDMVIVETPDAVMVSPRSRVQDVRTAVDQLKAAERSEATTPANAAHAWGREQRIHAGTAADVRRLVVNPGAELTLQTDAASAEEWVVVAGSALVTVDGADTSVAAGEHVSLAAGHDHRIANPGTIDLEIIAITIGQPAKAGA